MGVGEMQLVRESPLICRTPGATIYLSMTAPPAPNARATGLKEGGEGIGGGVCGPGIPAAGGMGGGTTTGGMTKPPQLFTTALPPLPPSCPCIVERPTTGGLPPLPLLARAESGGGLHLGTPTKAGGAPASACAQRPTLSASATRRVAAVERVDSRPHDAGRGRRFRCAGGNAAASSGGPIV